MTMFTLTDCLVVVVEEASLNNVNPGDKRSMSAPYTGREAVLVFVGRPYTRADAQLLAFTIVGEQSKVFHDVTA